MNNHWTKEEVDLLLAKKKVTTRSKKSIRRKILILGLDKPKFKVKKHKKKPWTKEEIELLKKNKTVPNRTKESIRCQLDRLGILKKQPYRKPWKKKDECLLRKLVKQNHTTSEIFKMGILPYSKMAIQKKICNLGLSKKSKTRRLSKLDLLRFKNFLKENYIGKTPIQLCEAWNQNNTIKVSKKQTVYHLSKLKIKISYAEVIRINIQKEKEEKIKKSFNKSTKTIDQKIRESRAEIMRKRFSQGKDIWSGLPITENIEI